LIYPHCTWLSSWWSFTKLTLRESEIQDGQLYGKLCIKVLPQNLIERIFWTSNINIKTDQLTVTLTSSHYYNKIVFYHFCFACHKTRLFNFYPGYEMSKISTFFYHNNQSIRAITKLPNSEQSSKGKVKTHRYINRQNQSTIGKLGKP
jgi:hypothetical protein